MKIGDTLKNKRNEKIVQIIDILGQFYILKENSGESWIRLRDLQERYYVIKSNLCDCSGHQLLNYGRKCGEYNENK